MKKNRGRIGKKQHEDLLKKTIKEMEEKGWKVIDLKGRSPDAIAAKNENDKVKIIALEILGMSYNEGKGWHKSWTYKEKMDNYSMFDEVIIKKFKRTPPKRGEGCISHGKNRRVQYR